MVLGYILYNFLGGEADVFSYEFQALIMYHLQRYAAAMSILEPLYRNIEPIDEVCGFFNYVVF